MELESRVVPEANGAEEAGRLLLELPRLWGGASLEERRNLLITMLDAVYVDSKETRSIVAVKPKAPFRPVFQVAATKEGSGVVLVNEPPGADPEARMCFWWRRGRVALHLEHGMMVLVQAA